MRLPAELRARGALDVVGRELSDGEPPQLGAEVFLLRAEYKGQHALAPHTNGLTKCTLVGPIMSRQLAVEQTVQTTVADACSFVGAGSHIRCAEPGGVSGVVGLLLLRLALRSHPRPVVLDLPICLGAV